MNIAEVFVYRSTPLGSIFSYEIPDCLLAEIQQGQLVEIPFGRMITKGLIWHIKKDHAPFPFALKAITKIVDPKPVLLSYQRELIEWLITYYHAPLLSVVKTVLPDFLFTSKKSSSFEKIKSRIQEQHEFLHTLPINKNITLSRNQQYAIDTILTSEKKRFLLHGITGSGKTEVYLATIKKIVAQGKQALLLVPEISLTPQMLHRLQHYFQGQELAVWHSHLSVSEKQYYWSSIRNRDLNIVIGSRSAIFCPLVDLGIVVIDEEHEQAYKQDNNPRYDVRTITEKLVDIVGCKVVAGSATPRVEAYWQAVTDGQRSGVQLLELKDRFRNQQEIQQTTLFSSMQLPQIHIVDLRTKKAGIIFSAELQTAIEKTLQKKQITFLFLNRRGFSPYIFCHDCGAVILCKNCAVPLIFHRKGEESKLLCHHCGGIGALVSLCPACQSHNLVYGGIGTQKVEREVKKLWPKARVYRLDRDTMSKKNSYQHLYELLTKKKIDIVIGTQMITKGWDIPAVATIGIMLADVGLHVPDFRAGERTFQLLAQVAGRAGRRGEKAEVFCQTYTPDNTYIQKATAHDYHGFYASEIQLREQLSYPPFSQLVRLIYEDVNDSKAEKQAHLLAEQLYQQIAQDNLEIEKPYATPCFLTKIRNKYRWQIVIKVKSQKSKVKSEQAQDEKVNRHKIQELLDLVPREWKIDVDPVSMM